MSHPLDHERLDVYPIEAQSIGWSAQRIEQGNLLRVRGVSMLSKLVDRFSARPRGGEDPAHYGIEDDDEDEKEGEANVCR